MNFPIPKKGEPHYSEFIAVRDEIQRHLDEISWNAVIVAWGKSAHAWRSPPYELVRYDDELNPIVQLSFCVAVVNTQLVDDLGNPEAWKPKT